MPVVLLGTFQTSQGSRDEAATDIWNKRQCFVSFLSVFLSLCLVDEIQLSCVSTQKMEEATEEVTRELCCTGRKRRQGECERKGSVDALRDQWGGEGPGSHRLCDSC